MKTVIDNYNKKKNYFIYYIIYLFKNVMNYRDESKIKIVFFLKKKKQKSKKGDCSLIIF